MNQRRRIPAHVSRTPAMALALSALVLALSSSAAAAPSEGTAGQTVTGRAVHRADGSLRPSQQTHAPKTVDAKPAWKDLTSEQREALQPLASHWDQLSKERKLKWLVISENYPKLSPVEQDKMHRRMSKWVTLSQQQRAQARQNFKEINNLTPQQKAAQWEAYQALSAEEKRKLAAQAPTKATGLATVKPVTAPRLGQVPRRAAPPGAKLAEAGLPVHQHTLLPQTEPAGGESERSPYEDEPAESR